MVFITDKTDKIAERSCFPGLFLLMAFILLMSGCSNEYQIIKQNSLYLAKLQQDQLYTIGCGDEVEVKVWGYDNLSTKPVVRPDGKISLPLVGDVQAEGLAVEELVAELNQQMKEYIQEPSVSVTVSQIKSLKIYIIGEVVRQGEFELQSYMDVLQAIALAGGLTDYAKKSKIQIIRNMGGAKLKIKFNYNQVIKGKNLYQNIPLKPGDIILVP